MKRIMLSIVALLAVLTTQAQNKVSHKLEWDAHLGVGEAMIYDADAEKFYDSGSSINLGFGVGYPLSKVWSIRSGLDLYYSKPNINYEIEIISIDAEAEQFRVELPVMAGARLHVVENVDVLLEAGAYFSYGFAGTMETKVLGVSSKTDTYDEFMNFDSGLALGANLEIRHFVMGLNLRSGWAKAMDGMKMYNWYGQMTFGYKW